MAVGKSFRAAHKKPTAVLPPQPTTLSHPFPAHTHLYINNAKLCTYSKYMKCKLKLKAVTCYCLTD